jgi:hypothetical protein
MKSSRYTSAIRSLLSGTLLDDLVVWLYPHTVNNSMPTYQTTIVGAIGTETYKRSFGSQTTDISKLSLKLSENPSRDRTTLSLQGPSGHAVAVRLINILGQAVREYNVQTGANSESELPISLDGLPAGSYIVSALGDEGLTAKTMLSIQK